MGERKSTWGPLTSGAPPTRKQAQSVQQSPSDWPFHSGDEPGEVQVLRKLRSFIYQALTTCQVLQAHLIYPQPRSPSDWSFLRRKEPQLSANWAVPRSKSRHLMG